MQWFQGLDAGWAWLAIGIALAAAELAVPGMYLIWLALAALVTGGLTMVLDLGTAAQVVNFVFLALIIAYSAKRFLRDRPIVSSDPLLNNRGGRMIGQLVTVSIAIQNGEGRVKVGDSEWIARGPDCEAGSRVRIIGAQGATLTVEDPDAAQGAIAQEPEDPPA